MKPRRVVLVGVALAALLQLAPAVAQPAAESDPVLARAFEVRYRPLVDAADLVGSLLSADGSLTLKPRLRTLVVQDHAAVLERVAALLEDYDLPPRSVEVTLSLFLGTDQRATRPGRRTPSGAFSKEVRGVIETLGDFTKWTAYEPLGSRSVTGVEGGDPVVANLSDDYRVVFTVDAVHAVQGVVNVDFKRFSLQRMAVDDAGRTEFDNLYTTEMVLPIGRLHVVGAASDPGSKRALFLTLQVQAR